jgi:hypothetical protein
MNVRSSTFAVSDFKTLYASAWCFARGLDAYSIPNLQTVFVSNSVVQPQQWYAHAPVYPWTTLALISPLTALPMVPAAYLAVTLTGLLLLSAVMALMYYATAKLELGVGWRVAIAALCVSGPLLSFGIDMGNVSVPASALCVLAFVLREYRRPWFGGNWMPAAALALAVVLKPHLAIWCIVAMLLLPIRSFRSVGVRSAALFAAFTIAVAVTLAACGRLGLQSLSYLHMLSSESSAGASMSAASREALPIVAQITSLQSIVGYWFASPVVRSAAAYAGLLLAGLLLARSTRRVESERGTLLAISAWCSFGMLATYHRAHDATILLLLVPWAVSWVRRRWSAWHVWAAIALYCGMSVSADFPTVVHWLSTMPSNSVFAFVLLKQAALADALLMGVLLFSFQYEYRSRTAIVETGELHELRTAA